MRKAWRRTPAPGAASLAALILAALILAVGVLAPDLSRAQSDADAAKDGTAADSPAAFTPPMFGAPKRRIGAGSRELGAEAPCAEGAERNQAGLCPEDEVKN
jgi:hypothetical protein